MVYFAQAVGMADFLTRRSALKDTKPQRRFSLARLKKRSPVLSTNDCDVVKTAVKTLKGNQHTNITIYFFRSSASGRNPCLSYNFISYSSGQNFPMS